MTEIIVNISDFENNDTVQLLCDDIVWCKNDGGGFNWQGTDTDRALCTVDGNPDSVRNTLLEAGFTVLDY